MSVKRYDRREIYDVTYQAAGDECLPEPSENGEFVLWSDYAALLAATQWRPIETAPMDGTDILCWCVEPEFEGEENPHTEQRVCFFGQMQEDYSCWMSHYGYEQRPTHWMPLPKPPTP